MSWYHTMISSFSRRLCALAAWRNSMETKSQNSDVKHAMNSFVRGVGSRKLTILTKITTFSYVKDNRFRIGNLECLLMTISLRSTQDITKWTKIGFFVTYATIKWHRKLMFSYGIAQPRRENSKFVLVPNSVQSVAKISARNRKHSRQTKIDSISIILPFQTPSIPVLAKVFLTVLWARALKVWIKSIMVSFGFRI